MSKQAKVDTFNLGSTVEVMAEAIATMQGAETARILFNNAMGDCAKHKVDWTEIRDKLSGFLEIRGYKDGSLRTTLATVKWCYTNKVQLETFNLTRMKERAEKGTTLDLITGKPTTVKATKPKDKGKTEKTKSEATVEHCGIGMAKAMTQQGFIKFFNVLVASLSDLEDNGNYVSMWSDDGKLDIVRDALVECGYMTKEGAEYKVAVIKESEDEAGE